MRLAIVLVMIGCLGKLCAGGPSVVMVLVDDMGKGEIGVNGNGVIETPHLDALAGRSLRFGNFHVAPTCAPSRAQLMSGRHEFFVGVTHTTVGRNKLRDDVKLLPEYLREAGYATGMFGKWHLGEGKGLSGRSLDPHERGFGVAYYTQNQLLPRFGPQMMRNGVREQAEGYCVDVVFREAMDWMERQEGKFFAYIATSAPHTPLAAPKELVEIYEGKGLSRSQMTYYAMVSSIDRQMGKLIEWVDAREEGVLVIFMSDNGHAISGARGAGHGLDGKVLDGGLYNAGMRGAKGQTWQGATCVPAWWYWPGKVKPRVEGEALVSGMDVLPTLVSLAGGELEEGVQGVDLGYYLTGEGKEVSGERVLFAHLGRWASSDELARYERVYTSVFDGEYRLAWNLGQYAGLYRYLEDRGEGDDLSGSEAERVARMGALHAAWWREACEQMVNDQEQVRSGKLQRREGALFKVRPEEWRERLKGEAP
ncbi:sulfatase-like hydrolase/transferase [Rubritalea tangerina]|uniref:Sulfatase-like hydrolase/transferase n=1 Tax=Rubritalea tangerina TaxID=430798 RepID=A0ABW4ZBK0_9BACT